MKIFFNNFVVICCYFLSTRGCLNLDNLAGVTKVSKYSKVPDIVSPLNATARLAKSDTDEVDAASSNQPPTEEDMVLEVSYITQIVVNCY